MKKLLISFLIVAGYSYPVKAAIPPIVPEPVRVEAGVGAFRMSPGMKVFVKDAASAEAVKVLGMKAVANDSVGCGVIVHAGAGLVAESGSAEAYVLEVGVDRMRITANGAAGVFYALQTLRQLRAGVVVPCVRIVDYPRYGWRGMHLDVSRHFFGVAFIKQYLDILAAYKINTFHWHLTDSHGWRLEIRQYPRLTTVGGWRADREGIPMTIAEPTAPGEKASYGGYYTQAQVREILAYAAARFITVIPEIEMPGHCTAALVAYPQFADVDNPTPLLMPTGYGGDLMHNFCAGNDSTFVFLENILRETMALFPSPWIHIGGDEVRDGPWLGCSRCRRRMESLGLKSVRQLQAWFTSRIDSFVTANGRRMIGWDEVRNGSLAPGSTIMSWHGDPVGRDSAGIDHDVVMTPYRYTYFDFYQSDPRLEPDITYAGLFLDSVYAFNPGNDRRILGGEACLWTENVPTPKRVEYMLLPRMLALSEALWTPVEKKDYARFTAAAEGQMKAWGATGVEYAKSMFNPGIYPVYDPALGKVVVRLSKQAPGLVLRYTMDGREPGAGSALYKGPVSVEKTCVFKAGVFRGGRLMGKVLADSFRIHTAIGAGLRVSPQQDAEVVLASRRLLDGIAGTVEPYDGRWVSFHDSVVMLTIDLGRDVSVSRIACRFMEDQVSNIYFPRRIGMEWSKDGAVFESAAHFEERKVPAALLRHVRTYEKRALKFTARYIRIRIDNASLWKEPLKNQLFIDEVVVE